VADLKKTCWVSAYQHDNPFGPNGQKPYFRIFREAIHAYGSHHVVRQENVMEYRKLGISRVRILMPYYVPWAHYPRGGGNMGGMKPVDVVFIGHGEPDQRIDYVADIMEADIPLRIFGPLKYWKRYLPSHIFSRLPPIEPLKGDDYACGISAAKICLNFLSRGNQDRCNIRAFEVPACGGFLLSERSDVMQNLFEEGMEAEYFASSEELIDKIRFYLRNDIARGRIARQGYERCIKSGYDVMSRMQQWIKDVSEWRQA
jgi:hypothetical protein